ncbi:ATP-binding protein [Paracoccus sp. SSJ]|uniref:sensor histidine kinase n=1 Tax=Paracoccus sp. SSJ TaxID=3050636 RepID=UPI00254AE8E3|nr:ATP-binding protein [Paracoccus sp. SSJ]MDK8873032.1 ATP-binding protein [Paracoccus sp. SSJ]
MDARAQMRIEPALRKPAAGRWPLVLCLACAAAILWLGAQLAYQHYFREGHARAATALRLTVNALTADLARYEVVPQLVGDLDLIHQLAADPGNAALRQETNLWLAEQNEAVQASDIYLILPDGETIAHSGYLGPSSFVGQNFSYRPYVIDAMAGGQGRFYGIGTTSGVRGYFFSAPVQDDAGRITAVVAVKIGVDRIEASWRGNQYRVLVTDPEGTAFLSSEPSWLYHSIRPLTPERLARTESSRRYAGTPLAELPIERLDLHGAPVFRLPPALAGGPQRSHDYIAASEDMPGAGWTVHVLLDSAELRAEARLAVLSLALLLSVAGFGLMMWRQRRAQAAERLAMQQFATAELERRVVERTADLARVNDQLELEIAERRATEAELRAAQASLVQVGKLAALGQMSASLSHEINQPLAAARNYADSAAILIERGEHARARENIAQILLLVDRMAAIGKHLRHAARKPDDVLGAVALAGLLDETRTIVAARLASSGAELELDVPADLPPLRAGPTRLQQVLVNLITNAVDAVEGGADRRITLSARAEGGRLAIRVRDRGPGVPAAIAARIFDPFFTTKGMGAGLGLGLSITANIVRDFGGEIACRNMRPGAEFCVVLPAAAGAEAAETAA